MSTPECAVVVECIEDKLAKGQIRLSKSSAGTPVLFIKWETGELHFCADYWGLNAITKQNSYPLPLCNDLLDVTASCSIFTVINLWNTFDLICVAEGGEWKTAFHTNLGLYEMLVMLFGLTNAPANLQSFIQLVLSNLIDISCMVYLDNILIYSKSQDSHNCLVRQVLEWLRGAELYADPKKCKFNKNSMECTD